MQGSNIKAALNSNYNRIPCSCHCIFTALKQALPEGPGDKGDTKELQALMTATDAVKALVRYVKKSGINAMLSNTLLQENDTQWNSLLLMMLESVIKQEQEVKSKLQERNEFHRIECMDFSLLRNLVNFLKPLQQATKALEGENSPTIHRVVLWSFRLLQHTAPQPFDCPTIVQLKSRLADALPKKMEITLVHKLALFLQPQYKRLRKFSVEEQMAVHSLAWNYINMLQKRDLQRQQLQAQLEANSSTSKATLPTSQPDNT